MNKSSSVLPLLRKKFTIEGLQRECVGKQKNDPNPNSRIFAFEDPTFNPGCRKFIVSDMRKFYLWYRDCPPHQKHFYELILENTPCRLYFDLEFPKEHNPEVDGISMLAEFCEVVCRSLKELLDVDLETDKHFLVLDSTSASKFSAHVIVHLAEFRAGASMLEEERIFPDNVSLKRIIIYICSKLLQEKRCLIKTGSEPDQITFLCDTSVYSKNRNFRLFQSSKCGKTQVLELADYCNFYKSRQIDDPKRAQIFLDSLVIPYNYQQLAVVNLDRLPMVSSLNALLDSYKRQLAGKQAPGNLGNFLQPRAPQRREGQQQEECVVLPEIIEHRFPSSNTFSSELMTGSTASPFPELDEFMLRVFQCFNPRAEIRVWKLICEKPSTSAAQAGDKENANPNRNAGKSSSKLYKLQYQLNNSRFCLNRGREHQSQNVYWTVDLSTFSFFQRCFDTIDCPNFCSQQFALPRELCECLHAAIGPAFDRLGISDYFLPDLNEICPKRYPASSESFERTAEWREKYGNLSLLLTPSPNVHKTSGKAERAPNRTPLVEILDLTMT